MKFFESWLSAISGKVSVSHLDAIRAFETLSPEDQKRLKKMLADSCGDCNEIDFWTWTLLSICFVIFLLTLAGTVSFFWQQQKNNKTSDIDIVRKL